MNQKHVKIMATLMGIVAIFMFLSGWVGRIGLHTATKNEAALMVGSGITIGILLMTLFSIVEDVTALNLRINDPTNHTEWEVSCNGIKLGLISDVQLAKIKKLSLLSKDLYTSQVLNWIKVSSKEVYCFFKVLPIVLVSLFIFCMVLIGMNSPELIPQAIEAFQADPISVSHLMSQNLIAFIITWFGLTMLLKLGQATFCANLPGYINYFDSRIHEALRHHFRVISQDKLILTRVEQV